MARVRRIWRHGHGLECRDGRGGEQALAATPDGKRVAIERSWGIIELLDVESGTSSGPLSAVIAPWNWGPAFGKGNLAFSADGTLLFVGAFKNGIYVWKLH